MDWAESSTGPSVRAIRLGTLTRPHPTGARALHHEIFRKRIDPGQISYDGAAKTLSVRVTLAPGEATGTLREFGVFGGDASAWPESGYLVSYRVHPKIEKPPQATLDRELHLTMASD